MGPLLDVAAGRGLDGVDLTARMREWAFEIQDVRSWFEVWQTDEETICKARNALNTL